MKPIRTPRPVDRISPAEPDQLARLEAHIARLEAIVQALTEQVERLAAIQPGQRRAPRPKVKPETNFTGQLVCPVHHKRLQQGKWGWFCTAKAAEGQHANQRGYCGLRFAVDE